jgi:hypothetical protein
MTFLILQLVLQVVTVILLVRSKRKSALLAEPSRSDRNYMINAALVCNVIVIGITGVMLTMQVMHA